MVFEISDYELSRRFASLGAGVRDQRYTSNQVGLISSSGVGFFSYYHSNGGSLEGIDVSGLDRRTIMFLEEEIKKGKKTRNTREPRQQALANRYFFKSSGQSKKS